MTEVCVVCVPGRVVETMDDPRHVHDIVLPPLVTSHTRRHATPRHATLSDEYIVCLSVSELVQHDDLVRIDDKRERERRERRKRSERAERTGERKFSN